MRPRATPTPINTEPPTRPTVALKAPVVIPPILLAPALPPLPTTAPPSTVADGERDSVPLDDLDSVPEGVAERVGARDAPVARGVSVDSALTLDDALTLRLRDSRADDDIVTLTVLLRVALGDALKVADPERDDVICELRVCLGVVDPDCDARADGLSVIRGDVPTVLVAVAVPVAVFVALCDLTADAEEDRVPISLRVFFGDADVDFDADVDAEFVFDKEGTADTLADKLSLMTPVLEGDTNGDALTTALQAGDDDTERDCVGVAVGTPVADGRAVT